MYWSKIIQKNNCFANTNSWKKSKLDFKIMLGHGQQFQYHWQYNCRIRCRPQIFTKLFKGYYAYCTSQIFIFNFRMNRLEFNILPRFFFPKNNFSARICAFQHLKCVFQWLSQLMQIFVVDRIIGRSTLKQSIWFLKSGLSRKFLFVSFGRPGKYFSNISW